MKVALEQPEPAAAQQDEDTLLAQRWQRGDLTAAEALIRRTSPRLLAFLSTRALHRHEAEDLAQEVFLAVSRSISGYHPERPFVAWLYSIARHKIADAWRGHRPTETFDTCHETTDGRTPASLHAASDQAAAAWRHVHAKLPEMQAAALWLRVQEEMPLKAIAEALETSVDHVKVLLFRARQTLSRTWNPDLCS